MPNASGARDTVALLFAMVGIAAVGFIPYTRSTYSRERGDLERARAPLASAPLADFRPDQDRALTVILPTDRQWQRLVDRLGGPAFVLMVANGRPAVRSEAYPATDARLQAHGNQRGQPLAISLTSDLPFDDSSAASMATPKTAYRFSPPSDGAVLLAVRAFPAGVPDGAVLMVVPRWNHLEFWHWSDSLSMGQGLFELAAPVILVVAVVLIVVGLVVGLIPTESAR